MSSVETVPVAEVARPESVTSKSSAIWLAALSFTNALWWIPIIVFLSSPDRTVYFGDPGRLLVIGTVVIQFFSIALGIIFTWVASSWDGAQGRKMSRIFGWIGYAAAVIWVAWTSMSMLELDEKQTIFGALCILYLAPATVPLVAPRVRATVGYIAIAITLAATGILTIERLSPILIAPSSVYIAAIVVSIASARRSHFGAT